MAQTGLRERKKAATRGLIAKTAERLFASRGFDSVTLEEVADECVVSVKTVLRYFPTKEALALARAFDGFANFKEGFAERDADAVTYWRAHMEAHLRELATQQDMFRREMEMIHAYPDLEAYSLVIRRWYEDLLADGIRADTGDDSVVPRLFAASLMAANTAAVRHWQEQGGDFDPSVPLALIDDVRKQFAAGFPPSIRS